MVFLGIYLRVYSPVPKPILAIAYLGIGVQPVRLQSALLPAVWPPQCRARRGAGKMKITILDRILLLLTCLLAAWQVAMGINSAETLSLIGYTIGFGVLLVAGLLLIIFGFDVLDSPAVVIISTIIPLSLSLGLVWEHLSSFRVFYLIFVIIGFLTILITRIFPMRNKLPVIILASVHGVAGCDDFPSSGHPGFFRFGTPFFRLGGFGRGINRCWWLVVVVSSNGKPTSLAKNPSQGSSRFVVPHDSLFCNRFQIQLSSD